MVLAACPEREQVSSTALACGPSAHLQLAPPRPPVPGLGMASLAASRLHCSHAGDWVLELQLAVPSPACLWSAWPVHLLGACSDTRDVSLTKGPRSTGQWALAPICPTMGIQSECHYGASPKRKLGRTSVSSPSPPKPLVPARRNLMRCSCSGRGTATVEGGVGGMGASPAALALGKAADAHAPPSVWPCPSTVRLLGRVGACCPHAF